MTKNTPVVGREDLGTAAFQLLASSTADRYADAAERVASDLSLVESIKRRSELLETWLDRAKVLWREVLAAPGQRSESEIELALLLVVLNVTASDHAKEFLRTVAVSDRPSAAWLAALARRLLGKRSESETITVWPKNVAPRVNSEAVETDEPPEESEEVGTTAVDDGEEGAGDTVVSLKGT